MKHYVAVDWGTTNFRAYLLTEQHRVVSKLSENKGLLSVKNRDFSTVLLQSIRQWKDMVDIASLPIYMAGMIGSRKGWYEVPYLPSSIELSDIKENLYEFSLDWGAKAFIVPGLQGKNCFSLNDVMRGEETQLVGLRKLIPDSSISAIFPGTHSKHMSLVEEHITDFYTVMTGELFALLNQYSILTKDIPEYYDDQNGFLLGVEKGYCNPLNSVLFSARTLLLDGSISSDSVRSYLSGLLIGNELALLRHVDNIFIVGGESLSHKYDVALSFLGKQAHTVNGEACFLAGMKAFLGDK
ncbi:hypothetical protein B0186_08540 [Canicola haemoglobinophilus]|uniref:2-keto-3-deoxy-galactonokinase n=1 Tax=Canicola haemoglobinophilus TaxID=733 RepID=A0A1V4AZT5_9PAST|nr:2-dehydro-3-deoxygalactonokinase [Canicola haemoglobinophilus]OOR98835.1 hypothetical protein B0186_08540 [Canicola haemoglobinophilus]STO53663.1 2-keto-3-deoxy-galactonokinase [Canicola haemoglobinophilus]STO60929.1 2-keto-3-deoxy-galactonokinase [Canicola haemoglobinophilus]STO68197.1 2-keto-3-deoxy-galactonokinase [Canicola haemoglobinophilus]